MRGKNKRIASRSQQIGVPTHSIKVDDKYDFRVVHKDTVLSKYEITAIKLMIRSGGFFLEKELLKYTSKRRINTLVKGGLLLSETNIINQTEILQYKPTSLALKTIDTLKPVTGKKVNYNMTKGSHNKLKCFKCDKYISLFFQCKNKLDPNTCDFKPLSNKEIKQKRKKVATKEG